MEQIKLNLGGGTKSIDGFVNIDRKCGTEVYPLAYENDSVCEMRASHILEHFGWKEIMPVLKEWFNKLKPGGLIKIAVPDFGKIVNLYKENKDELVPLYVMGDQKDENNFHKSMFDKQILSEVMESAGFCDIKEWSDDVKDTASLPVSLRLSGKKPDLSTQSSTVSTRKIVSVMSMPRLAFSDNMTCILRHVVGKGIPMIRSSGVFWGQCLTRLIKNELAKNPDYVMTIDYDSWFTYEDIVSLCQLLESNPSFDAAMPLQIKRESESPLVGIKPKDGQKETEIPKEYLIKNNIIPVDTGHFGLTVFRASCFDKMKKPWFIPKPDENGEWEENRIDEDVMFWHNFKESGLKLGLATKVRIGHLQLRVTYPSSIEKDWKPIHLGLDDIDSDEKRKELIA